MQNTTILEKVNTIEKNLQALKLEFFLRFPEQEKKKMKIYEDEDIIETVKKIRKKLWNEKYSKEI